jgi:probable phosphoglycerate mutase
VYSSPLERTRETAAPIARTLGLRVRTERGLLECDIGEWTGARTERLARTPEWSVVQRWPAGFRFPGGESFAEMSTRVNTAVLGLVAAHPGDTIVAVSHADPIRAVLASAAGAPLDAMQRMVVAPCSVSAVLYGTTGPYVLTAGSTATFEDLALS